MSLVFSDGGRTMRYEAVGMPAEVFGTAQFLALFDRFFGGGGAGDAVAESGDGCLRFLGSSEGVIPGAGCVGVGGIKGGDACVGPKSGDLGARCGVAEESASVGVSTSGGGVRDRLGVERVVSFDGTQGCASEIKAASCGVHYWKNKKKREKKKRMAENWREGGSASVATVCTVDTRTAAEVEAARTLAERRTAENKVATALAGHKLRALQDKDRTVMVDRLAAARAEQRINDAKAKSQASFKQCDESMKSLGSSGSAGEFALKQEIKKARDNEKIRQYIEKQAQMFAKYATSEVRQMVAEIPPPVFEDEFDVFGDCPSDYDEDERQAYYDDLNQRNAENYDRCMTYC